MTLLAAIVSPPRNHRDELVRYVIIGGCGYLLALVVYAAQIAVGVSAYAAVPTAFVLNGLFNFTLIRLWAFPRSGSPIMAELGKFSLVALVSLVVNYAALYLLHGVAGMPPVPAQALANVIAVPVGFLGNKYFSFAAP